METIIFYETKLLISNKKTNGFFIPYDQILYVIYEKPYVALKMTNKSSILIMSSIAFFDQNLPGFFSTINRSTIVNLQNISEYKREKRHLVVKIINGYIFHVSQQKKKLFIEKIDQLKEL